MSVVGRYSDREAADWATRTPEPVDIDMPGWEKEVGGGLPNERHTRLTCGESSISVTRYWDRPLHAGGPMSTASTRAGVVGGQPIEIVRTAYFEGRRQDLEVVFLKGWDWTARVVFRACAPHVVDAACAAIRLAPR